MVTAMALSFWSSVDEPAPVLAAAATLEAAEMERSPVAVIFAPPAITAALEPP